MLVSSDRLADPEGSLLRIDDDRCGAVAVAIVDGQLYAFQDTCTHQQCSPTSWVSVYAVESEEPQSCGLGAVGWDERGISLLGEASRTRRQRVPLDAVSIARRQRGAWKSSLRQATAPIHLSKAP
jgi:hypothetical protein